jgi:hypothetical protein
MSLTNLHTLGEHKFRGIVQQLMRGVPASSIAQLIQHEWRDCSDVQEEILIEELESLHTNLSAVQRPEQASGLDLRRVPEDVRARLERLERENQETERRCYEAYAAAEQVFEKLNARRERK